MFVLRIEKYQYADKICLSIRAQSQMAWNYTVPQEVSPAEDRFASSRMTEGGLHQDGGAWGGEEGGERFP